MTDTPKDRDMDEAVERSRLIERALLFFELNASEGIFWDGDGHKIDPQDDLMEYANAVGIGESMDGFGEVTAHVKAALRAERDAAQLSEDGLAKQLFHAEKRVDDLLAERDAARAALADAEKRCETMREALDEAAQWKTVAKQAGVCMTCAIRAPEPYGCTDCLNTGWDGGSPAGFVREAELADARARAFDEAVRIAREYPNSSPAESHLNQAVCWNTAQNIADLISRARAATGAE